MATPKTLAPKTLAVVFLGGALVLGAAVGALAPEEGQRSGAWDAAFRIGLIAALVLGFAFTIAYWRRLDEAAQEAHKWAWYWGGSLGLAPAAFVAFAPELGVGLGRRLGYETGPELFQFGVVGVVAFMLIGYLAAWGLWWFRRR
jgi:hypothetical protein